MATPDILNPTGGVAEDLATCSLCGQIFTDPKLLLCLHTFCRSCLDDHISKSTDLNGQRSFKCPTCEVKIEIPLGAQPGNYGALFHDDSFMAKLVELMSATKDDKDCDICKRRQDSATSSSISPATDWCLDCSDAFCDICLKVHLHGKLTATHAVLKLDDLRRLPLESSMKKKNKTPCDVHGEFITLFCVDCREPLCVQCMAVSHRRCENVITVADAMRSRSDVSDVMSKLNTLQIALDSVDGLGDLEKKLEETISSASNDIRSLTNSLCESIRKQEERLLKTLDEKAAEARSLLRDRIEPKKANLKQIKAADKRMRVLMKYGSDVEILLGYNQVQKQMEASESSTGTLNPNCMQVKISFSTSEPVDKFLKDFKSLGEIGLDTGAEIGLSSWGVTCTSNEDIIVTDCQNLRIQKFSRNGELVDHIQLDDEPRDITTCGDTEDVAVTVIGRIIMFLSTRSTLRLLKKTRTERQYDGISYSKTDGYLVTSCVREKRIDVIQLDGAIVRSFCKDIAGEFLCDEPRYVEASVDGNIVISDISNNLVKCISMDGYTVFTYKPDSDKELKSPQGICVDKIGNIFVADNGNNRVQLLTSYGAFQRFILQKESGLEHPCAIRVSSSNRLIIVQNDGMVKVYSYS
ncbi:hypothetical protein CHS0354_015926 [Potamilus streckersoni]|uniref:Uncharacterized protein n=1 Tax=Potamilus streckersoni TaxID=2493646 RepID=A0AAE0SR13_9BIVA|nr:hypothetical protein CHS0354_015926 [Potamilus streckersoni]